MLGIVKRMGNDPSAGAPDPGSTSGNTSTADSGATAIDPQGGRGRVALVTDIASPIGEAIAQELLQFGFEVWGSGRGERAASLAAGGVHTVELEPTDEASLTRGVGHVLATAGRVDVLVNTAGLDAGGTIEHMALTQVRRQFEANVLAPARLAQLVLPSMREHRGGRIITVAGASGSLGQALGPWFHATSAAAEAMGDSLRLEVAPYGVRVVLVEPGPLTGEWASMARRNLEERSRGTSYAQPLSHVTRFMRRFEGGRFTSRPAVVARTVVEAALLDDPKQRYEVGVGAGASDRARKVVTDQARKVVTDQALNQLWKRLG